MSKPSIDNLRRSLQTRLSRVLELQNLASVYQQLIEANTIMLSDIIRTRQALKELVKNPEKKLSGLINLGAGVFVRGEITVEEKVLVDIGAELALPMTLEEAIEKMNNKERAVRKSIENARQMLTQVQEMINKLQDEIEQLRRQLEQLEKRA
ncbi:MAG: prefoldin subunit alpha [Candidatus Njordarchaeales archaeon]